MKHTQGKWITGKDTNGNHCVRLDQRPRSGYLDTIIAVPGDPTGQGCGEANAKLIAEAGTVHNDTGYSPRQLADQKDKLAGACEVAAKTFRKLSKIQMLAGSKHVLIDNAEIIEAAIAAATN